MSRSRAWTAAKSAMRSPWYAASLLVRRELADRVGDLLRADHEPVLEDVVVRHTRDVRSGDPGHRSIEIVERLLGDQRRNLGAIPAEPIVFIDDQTLAGLAHRLEHGLVVERPQGPQVDHLDAYPLLGDPIG